MEEGQPGKQSFFACYLLCSLCPRFKGATYIGFTVNPSRRIQQHNGEKQSGAWRTKRKRPWEMILCIYGFPSQVSALQFEWAWQHPKESLAVREAANKLKSLSGIGGKVILAYTMLTLPEWISLDLTVNFFSTQYLKYTKGCPALPSHMKVSISGFDDLPCYTENWVSDDEDNFMEENLSCSDTENADKGNNKQARLDRYYHGKKPCQNRSKAKNVMKTISLIDSPTHSISIQNREHAEYVYDRDQDNVSKQNSSSMVSSLANSSVKENELLEPKRTRPCSSIIDNPANILKSHLDDNSSQDSFSLEPMLPLSNTETGKKNSEKVHAEKTQQTIIDLDIVEFPSFQEYSPISYFSPSNSLSTNATPLKTSIDLQTFNVNTFSTTGSGWPVVTTSPSPVNSSQVFIDLTDSP